MTSSVQVSFLGGVGVIGSSKILMESEGWRVLLDLGLDIPSGTDLLRAPAAPRAGRELADRLRLGVAPKVEGLFRSSSVAGTGLGGGPDPKTVVFISHAHLDHIGLVGWVDPGIEVYAAEESIRMMRALAVAGPVPEGGIPTWRPLEPGNPVSWGPFTITGYPVDHDVPGAMGFLVRTEAGSLAYTGDFRLHGRHPEQTESFARLVQGVDVLVTEGTMLTAGFTSAWRTESQVDEEIRQTLTGTPGLVVISIYPRNIERVQALIAEAAEAGRTVVWPDAMGRFLREYGLDEIVTWDQGPDLVEIHAHPDRYVVQFDATDMAHLLDLPLGPGAVFIHANGEPLGAFEPRWELFQAWIERLRLPLLMIGSAGHASPHDLDRVIAMISPRVVIPIHTADPARLLPPVGTARVLAERGRTYDLAALGRSEWADEAVR